jgi:cyclic pyranopterin phosphate synthase
MAAKRTSELIPLCHPLPIDHLLVSASLDDASGSVYIKATVSVTSRTGVEMEALTAVSVACLTVYDMVKAVDRNMRIEGIRLLEKSGGTKGDWHALAHDQDRTEVR